MGNISRVGRILYGIAIAEMGLQAVYYHGFPYILSLPKNWGVTVIAILAILFGMMFVLAGACIVSGKRARQISLLFGGILLLIFCFYYIPYVLIATSNYMHLAEWENAVKELSFAGGAFVIAGCFPKRIENSLTRFLGKLIPYGAVLFAITMIDYGISHFLYAKEAADYIPSWIPYHMFWMYFCGVALLGSGISIIFKIKTKLIATLLGTMILIWFVSLHIPRVIVSPVADIGDEITSAILALAYSGTAFVIAGAAKR